MAPWSSCGPHSPLYYQRVSVLPYPCFNPLYCLKIVHKLRVPTAKFVQILNVHGNHWITLSNMACAEGAIQCFDSTSNSTGLQNNDKLNCLVASLFDSDTMNITVINVNIKQQEGASDCGLFAIVCAFVLTCLLKTKLLLRNTWQTIWQTPKWS